MNAVAEPGTSDRIARRAFAARRSEDRHALALCPKLATRLALTVADGVAAHPVRAKATQALCVRRAHGRGRLFLLARGIETVCVTGVAVAVSATGRAAGGSLALIR